MHRPAEPCLVRRHHLHPGAPRLPLPGSGHGLGVAGMLLAWRLSNTLDARLLRTRRSKEALERYSTPEIFNT